MDTDLLVYTPAAPRPPEADMTELITTAELDAAWVDLSGVTSALTTWTDVTSPDRAPRTPLVRPIITRFPDSADPDQDRRAQFHELLEALHEVIASIMAGLDERSWARRLWQELAHAGEDLRDLIADDRTVAPDDACNDPRAHLAYVSWGMVVPPLLVPTWRHLVEDHPPDEAYEMLFENHRDGRVHTEEDFTQRAKRLLERDQELLGRLAE